MADNDSSRFSYSSGEDEVRDERSSRPNRDNNLQEEEGHDDSSSSSSSSDEEDHEQQHASDGSSADTIALFGASGPTGHHFLRLALDAGYRVRALLKPGTTLEQDFEDVLTVAGSLEEAAKVQEVVFSCTYVVCMLGDTIQPQQRQDYPKECLLKFVKTTLYPIMMRQDDPVVKGFLFQATSLAADGHGKTPLFSKVMKKMKRSAQLQDVDAVVQYVHSRHRGRGKVPFPYIVTRPSFVLKDGPSTKKLAASKSQPGPFPCSHVDLAEFSLNALKTKKLFNSCPYVVGDGVY